MANPDDRNAADALLLAIADNTAALERVTERLDRALTSLDDIGHELYRLVENKRDRQGLGSMVEGVVDVARDAASLVRDIKRKASGRRLRPLR